MTKLPKNPEAWLASLLAWKLAGHRVPEKVRECQICGAMLTHHIVACEHDDNPEPSGLDCWNLLEACDQEKSLEQEVWERKRNTFFVVADVLAAVESQRGAD